MEQLLLPIQFNEPSTRFKHEKKSKLLKPDTPLYNHLVKLQSILKTNNIEINERMALHSEVLNSDIESSDIFIDRVNMLESRTINVSDANNYSFMGRAIVLLLGELPGYRNKSHITIAFIPDDTKRKLAFDLILKNLK